RSLAFLRVGGVPRPARAANKSPLAEILGREIIGPRQALRDVQDHVELRIPKMPDVKTAAEWDRYAERLRQDVLDKVVFRGQAKDWSEARARVKWLDTIPGG